MARWSFPSLSHSTHSTPFPIPGSMTPSAGGTAKTKRATSSNPSSVRQPCRSTRTRPPKDAQNAPPKQTTSQARTPPPTSQTTTTTTTTRRSCRGRGNTRTIFSSGLGRMIFWRWIGRLRRRLRRRVGVMLMWVVGIRVVGRGRDMGRGVMEPGIVNRPGWILMRFLMRSLRFMRRGGGVLGLMWMWVGVGVLGWTLRGSPQAQPPRKKPKTDAKPPSSPSPRPPNPSS
ncbi:uncharacterized protein EV422DRAFT_324981 [Fimicolochytrium jonesii]|uniref:uncharacterized protein n=1 Tax=Fimicolochytrium jonesii TaxID=1396493 RepID=UPI0022FDC6E0|nr:uncharacterized protein EV422DRAFT_324981 [Fimicolochytrium jonesii]KAI8824553.1 hypothetical protein EV422DRAFT_324981 [Fimicolochytrium jonesii]